MSFSVIPGRGAGRLGFAEKTKSAFAFLPALGFSVAKCESTLVRFEKGNVFVNVYHGRSSYQVGAEIGRLHEGDIYALHELLTVRAPADIEVARCQTDDPSVLEQCLFSIAKTFEQNCGALLTGDASAFDSLRSKVFSLRQAATIQAQFGAIIDRGDKAWDSKDFSEAAALYERCAPALDETRRRRLEYLRKKAGAGEV